MKNFEVRYPTNGTAALQPKLEQRAMTRARIIEFPERHAQHGVQTARNLPNVPSHGILDSNMAQTIRFGTARGCAFDRIAPWQAVLIGGAFSLISLASLLIGL